MINNKNTTADQYKMLLEKLFSQDLERIEDLLKMLRPAMITQLSDCST